MGQYASIFKAEIHSTDKCVLFNLNRNNRGQSIAIFSDSEAAIKALSSNCIRSKGAASPFIRPELFCGITPHSFRAELRQEEERNRANLWKSLPDKDNLRYLAGTLTGRYQKNPQANKN